MFDQSDMFYNILILIAYFFGFNSLLGVSYLIYKIPIVNRFFERMDNDY